MFSNNEYVVFRKPTGNYQVIIRKTGQSCDVTPEVMRVLWMTDMRERRYLASAREHEYHLESPKEGDNLIWTFLSDEDDSSGSTESQLEIMEFKTLLSPEELSLLQYDILKTELPDDNTPKLSYYKRRIIRERIRQKAKEYYS